MTNIHCEIYEALSPLATIARQRMINFWSSVILDRCIVCDAK